MNKAIVVYVIALACVACNREPRKDAATRVDTAAGDTSAPAAIDHSAHTARTDSAPVSSSTVDHTQHMSAQPETRGADHTGHVVRSEADHSGHVSSSNSRKRDVVDHSQHAKTRTTSTGTVEQPASATAKVKTIVSSLLNDPEVQRKIASDTVLARLWQDASVRGALRVAPATHH